MKTWKNRLNFSSLRKGFGQYKYLSLIGLGLAGNDVSANRESGGYPNYLIERVGATQIS